MLSIMINRMLEVLGRTCRVALSVAVGVDFFEKVGFERKYEGG